jgi:hypothetical protein
LGRSTTTCTPVLRYYPVAFALKELTAADEVRIGALVKNGELRRS